MHWASSANKEAMLEAPVAEADGHSNTSNCAKST